MSLPWTEIGASGGGLGFVFLFLGLKFIHGKTKELDISKQSSSFCDERHKNVSSDLKKGDDKFHELSEKIDKIQGSVIRTETIIEQWAKQNGVKPTIQEAHHEPIRRSTRGIEGYPGHPPGYHE